jgi:uncharacterized protein YndB with AHSA1/START domain
MIDFTIEKTIGRPVDEVFAYVTDPEKLSSWQTNTVVAELQTDGPLALGSRLREVHKGPGGRELESTVEVVGYEPNSKFELHIAEGPLPIDGDFRFETTGENATKLTMRAFGTPTGFARFLQPLLKIGLRKGFEKDLDKLKQVLESTPSSQG